MEHVITGTDCSCGSSYANGDGARRHAKKANAQADSGPIAATTFEPVAEATASPQAMATEPMAWKQNGKFVKGEQRSYIEVNSGAVATRVHDESTGDWWMVKVGDKTSDLVRYRELGLKALLAPVKEES